MARHVEYRPDCPDCGRECGERVRISDGLALRWWQCRRCGWRSDQVAGLAAFDDPTFQLTRDLREADR